MKRALPLQLALACGGAGCTLLTPLDELSTDASQSGAGAASSATAASATSSGAAGGTGGLGAQGGGGGAGTGGSSLPDMVLVPAGPFWMGCDESAEGFCDTDEVPYRSVELDGFEIDTTEVTQADYELCLEASACPMPACSWYPDALPTHPVVCVDHAAALAFCAFVGKRLPTEAEWEKAARGDDARFYPWGNEAPNCSLAHVQGCGVSTMAVGSFPDGQSPYGALDMAGNVTEWVVDWYAADYYASAPPTNPPGPSTGTVYSQRGGSFDMYSPRAANREYDIPTLQIADMGFRCARTE